MFLVKFRLHQGLVILLFSGNLLQKYMQAFCLDLLQYHEQVSDTIVPCLPGKSYTLLVGYTCY
jgi:hypothetical protein